MPQGMARERGDSGRARREGVPLAQASTESMGSGMRLQLVAPPTSHTPQHTQHDVRVGAAAGAEALCERIFEAWRYYVRHGRAAPARLSDENRAILLRAHRDLGFDEPAMLLAVQGCAASPWCAGRNRLGCRIDSIAYIFRDEPTILRLADAGEAALRQQRREEEAAAQQASSLRTAAEALAEERRAEAARQRIRDFLSARAER